SPDLTFPNNDRSSQEVVLLIFYSFLDVFSVVAKRILVITGHPGITCGGPALYAQSLFPTLCPTRIQAVDVQSGIQVIKFVLQNPSKPIVGLKIYGITIDVESLEPNMIGALQRVSQSRY